MGTPEGKCKVLPCIGWILLSLLYNVCSMIMFCGFLFTTGDLDNYFKEMRYHVETTCDVINVTDLGPRDYCGSDENQTCWEVKVKVKVTGQMENLTQFHADLFTSFQVARDTDFRCAHMSCPRSLGYKFKSSNKISELISSGAVKCFYNPEKPGRAYMETGLSPWTFTFVASLIFAVVNFIICSVVFCIRKCDVDPKDVIHSLFLPCWSCACPLYVVFCLPGFLIFYLVKECCPGACKKCEDLEGEEERVTGDAETGNQAPSSAHAHAQQQKLPPHPAPTCRVKETAEKDGEAAEVKVIQIRL